MTTIRYSRSPEAEAYRKLYKGKRWRSLRAHQLTIEPLCRMCKADGRVTIATVADHIKEHKGNMTLFFDPLNLQSLCDADPYRCHSSRKQSIERMGFDKTIGADGFPVDPSHPANQ